MPYSLHSIILIFLLIHTVHSQSVISGDISDYSFDLSGSPYFIEKDILIPSGKSCTFEAGCVFLFRPFTGLSVEGTLVVNGTAERPVIFTSVNDTSVNPGSVQAPSPFDWNGITVSAESYGSSFRHFIISYSVYGIRSQTPNVKISQGLFSQNGQFNFTVKDKIQEVMDNIYYNFSIGSEPDSDTAVQQSTAVKPTAEAVAPKVTSPPEKKRTSISREKKILRFGSLGIGICGIAGGTVLAVMASNKKQEIEDMKPTVINPETGSYYRSTDDAVEDANSDFNRDRAGSIVCFILGGLGMTGFVVTFVF